MTPHHEIELRVAVKMASYTYHIPRLWDRYFMMIYLALFALFSVFSWIFDPKLNEDVLSLHFVVVVARAVLCLSLSALFSLLLAIRTHRLGMEKIDQTRMQLLLLYPNRTIP